MRLNRHFFCNILVSALCASALLAQTPATDVTVESPKSNTDPGYRLGPDDRITINALHAEEISGKMIQVDGTGFVNLPMVGRVKVGGLTVPEAETAIANSLKTYIERPLVTVNVTEYQSQPVSVLGAVTTPGQYQVKGQKTILDMLSMAGGLKPDSGHVVRITRRLDNGRLPLPGATEAPSGQFTVAEIKLKALMELKDPAQNLVVMGHDVITIPKAEMIYVMGEVQKAGGFVLNDQENLSAIQALALAGGITKSAAKPRQDPLRVARLRCWGTQGDGCGSAQDSGGQGARRGDSCPRHLVHPHQHGPKRRLEGTRNGRTDRVRCCHLEKRSLLSAHD